MALLTLQRPSLFGGVSQQPPVLRDESQCEALVNALPSVVDGVSKRPPSEHIARFTTDDITGAYLHTINRDATEQYIVVITNGDLKVYDLAGNQKSVSFPLGKSYLETDLSASRSFSVVSIADYSFVVNKTKVVQTKVAPTETPEYFDYWFFPKSWHPDGQPSSDAYVNQAQGTYRGIKQTFEELPKPTDEHPLVPPEEGDVWKVAGADEDGFGAYYVIRRGGVWEETHGTTASITLDEMTMPWALISEADGTFTFTVFPWKARKVGDTGTNPAPSFVGRTIRDIFYYKNRLGILSGENVVFSAAGDFGNFFRTTVTDLLDGDVVDAAVSSTNRGSVATLNFAVPIQNSLMLFSDQTQFRLNVDQLLTPKTVSIDTVTEFAMSTLARPVALGTDVYFATEAGNHSRIREYFVDEVANQNDATDVTAHVPRYIPKGLTKLVGSSNDDILFALSPDEPNRLYVYKFFWAANGMEKLQSAWSVWEFDEEAEILHVEALGSQLVLVVSRSDGMYLERVNLTSGAVSGSLDHQVMLDRLHPLTPVYDALNDKTTFTLAYPVSEAQRPDVRLVRGDAFGGYAMALLDPSQYEWVDDSTLTVAGDHSGGTVWAGLRYTFRITFSEQIMKINGRPVITGRTMLRTFTVYFSDTAYFRTEVAPYGTDAQVETVVTEGLKEFTGKTLGDLHLILGTPVFTTDKFSFQIHGDSRVARVSIVNDSHCQSRFQALEVEVLHHNRARPI